MAVLHMGRYYKNLTEVSADSVELAKNYIDVPLKSVSDIANLNMNTLRKQLDDTVQTVRDLSAMRKPIGFFACISEMLMHTVENNKSYYKNIGDTFTKSQNELSDLMYTQYNKTLEGVTKLMSGLKLPVQGCDR